MSKIGNFERVYRNFKGLRVDIPAYRIGPEYLQKAVNVLVEGGVIKKGPGLELLGEDLPDIPDGLHYTDGSKGDPKLLAFSGNNLLYWDGSHWSVPAGGNNLSSGEVPWSFADFRGEVYATSTDKDVVVYDPEKNKARKLGLVGPTSWTVIGYFEEDEEWLGDGEIVNDRVNPVEMKGKGKAALKLQTSGSGTVSAYRDVELNLTKLASGITADDWDLFEIWIYHEKLSAISSITLMLEMDTNNYLSHAVNLSLLDYPQRRDYQATVLQIPRGRFNKTGSASRDDILANITRVSITLTASQATKVYFDTWHFKQSPPVVAVFRKVIANFEPGEPWSGGTRDATYAKEMTALKIASSGTYTLNLAQTLDLTKWVAQTASYPSTDADEICIYVYRNISGNLSECKLQLRTNESAYFQADLLTSGGIPSGGGQSNDIRIKKSVFTAVGSPSWSSISSVALVVSMSGNQFLVFDSLRMESGGKSKWIAKVTASDNWTGTNCSMYTKDKGHWPTADWGASVHLSSNKAGADPYGEMSVTVDLEKWDDETYIADSDQISIWIETVNRTAINSVTLTLFSGSTSNYFSYTFSGLQLSVGGATYKASLSAFQKFGDPSWSNITKVRFSVDCNAVDKTDKAGEIYFAAIALVRDAYPTAKYQWRVQYEGDNFLSPASDPSIWYDGGRIKSEPLATKGARAVILNLKASPDPRVGWIHIYRSSTNAPTYKLESTAPNDQSQISGGWVVGYLPDQSLGKTLDPNDSGEPIETGETPAPRGARNAIVGAEHWIWGVSKYKDRIYYSSPFQPNAFAESKIYLFPEEVINVQSLHGSVIVVTNRGIKRIEDDIIIGTDFMEAGIAYHGQAKCHGGTFAFIGRDEEVYLWDGSQPRRIGTAIKTLLSKEFVDLAKCSLFYHRDYLYMTLPYYEEDLVYLLTCYLPEMAWTMHTMPAWRITKRIDQPAGDIYIALRNLKVGKLNGYANDPSVIRFCDDTLDTTLAKRIDCIIVMASGAEGETTTIKLRLYIDGVLLKDVNNVTVEKTIEINGPQLQKYRWFLRGTDTAPVNANFGTTFSVEITHEDALPFEIAEVVVLGELLPRDRQA